MEFRRGPHGSHTPDRGSGRTVSDLSSLGANHLISVAGPRKSRAEKQTTKHYHSRRGFSQDTVTITTGPAFLRFEKGTPVLTPTRGSAGLVSGPTDPHPYPGAGLDPALQPPSPSRPCFAKLYGGEVVTVVTGDGRPPDRGGAAPRPGVGTGPRRAVDFYLSSNNREGRRETDGVKVYRSDPGPLTGYHPSPLSCFSLSCPVT